MIFFTTDSQTVNSSPPKLIYLFNTTIFCQKIWGVFAVLIFIQQNILVHLILCVL